MCVCVAFVLNWYHLMRTRVQITFISSGLQDSMGGRLPGGWRQSARHSDKTLLPLKPDLVDYLGGRPAPRSVGEELENAPHQHAQRKAAAADSGVK